MLAEPRDAAVSSPTLGYGYLLLYDSGSSKEVEIEAQLETAVEVADALAEGNRHIENKRIKETRMMLRKAYRENFTRFAGADKELKTPHYIFVKKALEMGIVDEIMGARRPGEPPRRNTLAQSNLETWKHVHPIGLRYSRKELGEEGERGEVAEKRPISDPLGSIAGVFTHYTKGLPKGE